MATKTSSKTGYVKGKDGRSYDYAISDNPAVTAINKARAENIAAGRSAYAGAGATQLSASKGKGGYKSGGMYDLPDFSEENSAADIKKAGLTGLVDPRTLVGMRPSERNAKLASLDGSAKRNTALTSYTFSPAQTVGAKGALEKFSVSLQDTNSDPWASRGTKQEKLKGVYETTANELAKLFDSPEDFDSLLTGNADFAAGMERFRRAGGDLDSVRMRIGQRPGLNVTGYRDNPDGTTTNFLSDGSQETGRLTPNADGSFNFQSTQDYLAGLSMTAPEGSAAETEAFNDLLPERELAQAEIMRLAKIPQQYRDLYFGTPETVGVLEEKRIQAEEKKKLLERRSQTDERNLRAQANLVIESNEADMAIEEAQIEENRLAAKNYATGMLAKLGALNTTGAAPMKLAKIEGMYQAQAQQLRTKTRLANKTIALKLAEAVSDLELKTDEEILAVQSDLTKDREEVLKEVMKLEAAAGDKVYSIKDKAANELRVEREKYAKAAKALAEKNAKAYAKAAGSYDVGTWGGKITGGTEAERKTKRLAQYQEAFAPGVTLDDGTPTVDQNGLITPVAWKEAIKEAPSMGLTRKEFIENFGHMLYADDEGVPDAAYGLTKKEKGYLE